MPDNTTLEETCLYRCFKLEKNRLRDEDFAGLGAEISDFGLEQLDLLARAAAADFQETVDDGVEVDLVLVRHDLLAKLGEGKGKATATKEKRAQGCRCYRTCIGAVSFYQCQRSVVRPVVKKSQPRYVDRLG